ncbi:DEAD/DEAH box helicase [Ornithinimicrobium sp. F0845]|uniref:DEAD/DEAH box helicase n=1 Tax=Ornithinimicrobium sp. F0845 TaxID=2926412 RepID=UPI001FF2414B|nr:DEAD/DEAH box helicase [Ornithinimicrobium sp. F0845]MCK0113229.1 DEAD/DEAH box helicase [Ornithinimicrobium sp. F0845]
MSTPAERYAAARKRTRQDSGAVGRFAAGFDFPLDDFQLEAIGAVDDGQGVLVAAPTGAGKTVVGEFAVALALETGRKAFYTTPIKALSNQKYHDLVARHGSANVGLLTGDASVNGEAPVVVMTTEVLRNMMYSSSRTLDGLGFVVMDEVHYLADRFRGAVWEEVIIHLPESVQVISLSATVSNAEEFGDWLREVRGNTAVIVTEHRPVPLWQHMMVGKDLYDLFVHAGDGLVAQPAPTGQQARVNPELLDRISVNDRESRWRREDAGGPRGRRGRPHGRDDRGRGRRQEYAGRGGDREARGGGGPGSLPGGTASRSEVIDRLDREGLLPAITFIFSRAGCEGAVTQLLARGTRLVPPEEGQRIRRLIEERVAEVDERDLPVLGYHDFVEGLSRGFAAHHAGMLPLFREVVEELFTAGRIKAVFATETLALGINMPARTVVLEKLVKFNGEEHAPVTPAEYTQLTGRAGRRGIDVEGHAVVLYRRGLDPVDVAGLASTRTYPLRSSFRPTYNMAVNLVAQFGRSVAHELLQSSFAQFQADRAVVGLASQVRRNEEALTGYAESMHCELGDFREYARLRRQLSDAEKDEARRRSASRRAEIAVSLEELTPGDVISLPEGRRRGMALVLSVPTKAGRSPEPGVLTSDGQLRRVTATDLREPVEPVARLHIPRGFNPRNVRARKDLAATLRAKVPFEPPPSQRPDRTDGDRTPARPARDGGGRQGSGGGRHTDPDTLRQQLRDHPCHRCPDREEHARWAERWWQLRRETDDLQRRVSGRTNTVARTFDRICTLLGELGYLTEDGTEVTPAGARLRRIYTEKDLVAAQAITQGTWDRLDAPALAAVVSSLIHEPRGGDDSGPPRWPTVEVEEAFHEMVAIWSQLTDREAEHTLPLTGELDPGIAWMVHRWASGRALEEVLRDGELSAGDFVRRSKQVVDLLGQISQAADGSVAATARRASEAMLRGVVAADRLD